MLIVSSWWMSSAKTQAFCQGGLHSLQHKHKHDQWNSATDSCCFFHFQVCKFLFEDAAYEMIWMGTLWFLAPAGLRSWIRNGLANPSMKNQILNFKESENEFWNGHQWMLGRVLERLVADALASIFYAHLEAPQPKGFEAFLPKSTFCQAAFRASNTKTNMTNGIQLLTVAVFSLSSVQDSLWRCSLWNDMHGYAVISGACRVAILDTKRFGQSLNEKPDPQLQGKREWILERAPVNAGPSPWTARGWCVGQHLLCAFGSAAAKRIWGVLTQVKHFVKQPSGPPTQKQTWPMEFSYWQLLFFSLSSVQDSLWRCSLWNDMNGYAVVSGACRVAILDTKRFGQSLNEKPDPQLQGKREWILERAPVNAGPSPWTARGWCVGQHLLCAFGSAAAKRIWGVLTQVKHFVKQPSGPPTQKQTWPMEFSYWQLLFFSLSSVQDSLWRCSLWNDMNGYAVVSGACRVAILDTKRFGQSLNEKPDPQLQGKREWILERAPVNAGPSPWTARGWCVGQHLLCAFGSPAAKRIWGVLTQVMFMCCFSSSLTLGMPLARSWRPLWGLEPVDTRSFRSARRRIMAIGK